MNKQVDMYCSACHRLMDASGFYMTKRKDKYPNGFLPQCKKCLTLLVDNWNPETFTPILEEIDVPYIKDEWNKLLDRYGADPSKVNGTTILGRYLSKMKLKQWKEYSWADTERLAEESRAAKAEILKTYGMSEDQISAELDKSTGQPILNSNAEIASSPNSPLVQMRTPANSPSLGPGGQLTAYSKYEDQSFEDEIEKDLTEEDKSYLRIKWGDYRCSEWVYMEQLYNDMMASYDIQTAGHKDTLKMVCKTSLKANQLIDMNDIEGFQRMSRAYDILMKSGNFTAVQNKTESGNAVDSVGELVLMAETQGFIPKYYVDSPQDKADKVLLDYKGYVKNLINEETNLGELIQQAVQNIEKENKRIENAGQETDDNSLFAEDDEMIQDEDFQELNQMIADQLDAQQEVEDV